MGYRFQKSNGNWKDWDKHPKTLRVDYHYGKDHGMALWELEIRWHKETMEALEKAQQEGYEYVLCTHGSSTSRMGKQTARSEVRKIMQGKESTPYIIRKNCIDYGTFFLAAIKPKS